MRKGKSAVPASEGLPAEVLRAGLCRVAFLPWCGTFHGPRSVRERHGCRGEMGSGIGCNTYTRITSILLSIISMSVVCGILCVFCDFLWRDSLHIRTGCEAARAGFVQSLSGTSERGDNRAQIFAISIGCLHGWGRRTRGARASARSEGQSGPVECL